MRATYRTAFVKNGSRLALWLVMLCCYLGGLVCYGRLQKSPSIPVFFSSMYPDQRRVKEILRAEEEGKDPEEACFYWDGGIVTITEPEYGRCAEVLSAGILGNASLYDRRLHGFSEEDKDGCVLDEESALLLFGSREAEGRELRMGDRSYQVRRVLPWKQKMILFRPQEAENVYTRMFLEAEEGKDREKTVSGFLMSYGLSGTQASDGYLVQAALFSLYLFPAALYLSFASAAFAQRKQCAGKGKEAWIWTAICAGLTVLALWAVWKRVQIPVDWLPDRWSDFQFWPDKAASEIERVKLGLMLPKTIVQAENTVCCLQTMLGSFPAFLLYLVSRKKGQPDIG